MQVRGDIRRCRWLVTLRIALAAIAVMVFSPITVLPQPVQKPADQVQSAETTGKTAEPEPTDHVKVEGFRSARWGMDLVQVKAAIHKDFGVAAEKVKTEENASERTTVLSVTVSDLLEGAGPARISYIFGFSTKKLIQVTILWGTPVDAQAQPEKIVAASNQLRQLFLDSGYEPESVVTNARMADGTVLAFQGQDAEKHTTILRLASGSAPAPAKGSKEAKTGVTIALSLSYILDSHDPDIFRLKKGQFCSIIVSYRERSVH
jgi:hypothetical protein